MRIKKAKIPTLIALFTLILGISAGVLLVQERQIFKSGAETGSPPKDLRITNISDVSFSISWITDKDSLGYVLWGESQSSLDKEVEEEILTAKATHLVTVNRLSASKTYYFKIKSDGEIYDNNGIPWQVKTGASLSQPEGSDIVSGIVLTSTGTPAENALVYLTVGGASPLATITSKNGGWLIPLSLIRTNTLDSYYLIDASQDILQISVQAGAQGTSSVQIYAQSANPTPSIVLGKVHDFRNLPPNNSNDLPRARFDLPENSPEDTSKFNIPNEGDISSSTVILENIDEGEVINTQNPEFFGSGPPGGEIEITIESDPITTKTTVNSLGEWAWSPEQNLEEGPHRITISWRGEDGILKTLTRTFIVQAAEGPAFEASPSASPTPTSSPGVSPTPSPNPSASPTSTPRSTPTPTISATPTPPPIPESGSLTPTFLMLILGIGLIILGGFSALVSGIK